MQSRQSQYIASHDCLKIYDDYNSEAKMYIIIAIAPKKKIVIN